MLSSWLCVALIHLSKVRFVPWKVAFQDSFRPFFFGGSGQDALESLNEDRDRNEDEEEHKGSIPAVPTLQDW